jgi:hypothetical protein
MNAQQEIRQALSDYQAVAWGTWIRLVDKSVAAQVPGSTTKTSKRAQSFTAENATPGCSPLLFDARFVCFFELLASPARSVSIRRGLLRGDKVTFILMFRWLCTHVVTSPS